MVVDGQPLLAFCSNDYLGLANHPQVIEAWQAGASRWGVGGGASHLVVGHSTPHHELEEALAEGFIDEIFDDDRTAVSASLTPRERCERYTALYIEHVSLKNQEQMINKLRSMPAFSDCADEAAVMSRITEVVNKAQEHAAVVAERDALKEKVADLERKEREAAEAAYDAEVDTAREEERIGADEVPGFKALMRKDPENTRTLLAARKPKRRIMQTLASATGAEGKTDKDYLAEREAEVRARLKQ